MRCAIVAGEISGDHLAADLIQSIKSLHPDAEFVGLGGPAMAAAGCDLWYGLDELSVMGLSEVLKKLPRLLKLRRQLVQRLIAFRPHVFIGVDAPDFNLGIESRLGKHGINTVHYASPSLWAWRQKRAAKIGKGTDLVLCFFPSEPEIYRRHNAHAEFVGHPFADQMPLAPDRGAARKVLGLNQDSPLITLLPGSRSAELNRLSPVLANAARDILTSLPDVRFLLACSNNQARDRFLQHSEEFAIKAQLIDCTGKARLALTASDLAILASGTIALEAMLSGTPMIATYKVSASTHFIAKTMGMLKVNKYTLPNFLCENDPVPEFMQAEARGDAIAAEALAMLADRPRMKGIGAEFLRMHRILKRDASKVAAQLILGAIKS